jgi:MoxR-like ATPase
LPDTKPGEVGPSRTATADILASVQNVIIGKESVILMALAALVAGGHVLIEDRPGVGKTTLAKALAVSLGCSFKRIQFTPDLLPADVTGTTIYNQKSGEFQFRPGPIFANIVLADEINRTTPKTQSSLLESMDERQVTADGTTYALPRPFFVLATQNNIEFQGTYPCQKPRWTAFSSASKSDIPPGSKRSMSSPDRRTITPWMT